MSSHRKAQERCPRLKPSVRSPRFGDSSRSVRRNIMCCAIRLPVEARTGTGRSGICEVARSIHRKVLAIGVEDLTPVRRLPRGSNTSVGISSFVVCSTRLPRRRPLAPRVPPATPPGFKGMLLTKRNSEHTRHGRHFVLQKAFFRTALRRTYQIQKLSRHNKRL